MMISNVKGIFENTEAEIEADDDDFKPATLHVTVLIASLTTRNNDRDNHLKSVEFFDAEKYPSIHFHGIKFLSGDQENNKKLESDLTIKDITKRITLDVELSEIVKDSYGQTKIGVSAEGKISRKEFGLTWNALTETGGVVVRDEVKVLAEVQFTKQK